MIKHRKEKSLVAGKRDPGLGDRGLQCYNLRIPRSRNWRDMAFRRLPHPKRPSLGVNNCPVIWRPRKRTNLDHTSSIPPRLIELI